MADAAGTLPTMTLAGFEAWYAERPSGERYELLDGEIVEMQAERLAHGIVKAEIGRQLGNGIRAGNLPCDLIGDGMGVPIGEGSWFEPDAMVRCGEPLDDDAIRVPDPMIVVEVTSPSTQRIDVLEKFLRYFENPHLVHYLIVMMRQREVILHTRRGGEIVTTGAKAGILSLDPPGLSLDLDEVFASRKDA